MFPLNSRTLNYQSITLKLNCKELILMSNLTNIPTISKTNIFVNIARTLFSFHILFIRALVVSFYFRCYLTTHPLNLVERFNSSVQTIKLIHRICSIFENILIDEYEHLERISSNFIEYLMHCGTISNQIFSYSSQFTIQLNNRLDHDHDVP